MLGPGVICAVAAAVVVIGVTAWVRQPAAEISHGYLHTAGAILEERIVAQGSAVRRNEFKGRMMQRSDDAKVRWYRGQQVQR